MLYASSPVAQPATQTRTDSPLSVNSCGITERCSCSNDSLSRKNVVTEISKSLISACASSRLSRSTPW
jgi:hypothetical protein